MEPEDAAPESSPWLTATQAAARAQVGVRIIYKAVRAGRLRAAKLGDRNDLRIHSQWVDAWIAQAATLVNPDAPGADDAAPPLAFGRPRQGR